MQRYNLVRQVLLSLANGLVLLTVCPTSYAAYAEASCNGLTYSQFEDGCTYNVSISFPAGSSASGSGFAALASGVMRSTGQVTQVLPGSGGSASAALNLSDSIDFGSTPDFAGELRLRIGGSFSGTLPSGSTSQALLGALVVPTFGVARIDAYFSTGVLTRLPTDFNEGSGITLTDSFTAANVSVELAVPFVWTSGRAPITFVASLNATPWVDTAGTMIADFGNTAFLSVVVPGAQTFTSESGVLLTTPVPEPSNMLLMLLGLAVLGTNAQTLHSRTTDRVRSRGA